MVRSTCSRDGLKSSHRARSVYRFGDILLELDTCVELREPFSKWKILFVEIKSIWVSKYDGSIIICGLPYTRNHNLFGSLENKRNEVCQILEIDADRRSDDIPALCQINPQQILRVRTINKTNALYPRYCFGGDRQWFDVTDKEREEKAPLTCRCKFRIQSLVRLAEAEADKRFRISDKELKAGFRGRTHRGGSHKPQVIHLDGHQTPTTTGRKDRQYTFADVFCGAGGASLGAATAGLKVVFGVDFWPVACATWRRAFPGAHMYEQNVSDFIQNEVDYKSHPIDILHLSPPCQFWSPLAYPHAGRNNEENMAILFACPELIDKIRPRLFTLEQTFGLTHDAHKDFLNALIKGFTCHGYSVQWKIVPLVEYGLPQTRKRLVMIGACPGEQLPPWPPATHSAMPAKEGLKPFVTEAEAIRNLNGRRVTLHDVAGARVRNEPPRDGNKPFPKTITCGGTGGTSHFSGSRDFTVREIACLQGFPISYQFEGNKTAIKKQIGNAFPPCVVKAFYGYFRDWLQRVDGVRTPAPAQAPAPQVARPRPVVDRHQRGTPASISLVVEPRHHVNGNLNEDEALQLALQESRRAAGGVIDISDDEEEQQDSPVAAVAPLLERMSIAPPSNRASRSRSRSITLGRSPGPSPGPGPSRRATKSPSQKRSLDLMHDGDVDEVMEEESPPKRERLLETGHQESVDDNQIPSRLPRYAGPRGTYTHDADDENVAIGQSKSGSSQNGSRDARVGAGGSVPEDRDAHRGTAGDEIEREDSAIDWLTVFSQARMAGNSGNEVWTF